MDDARDRAAVVVANRDDVAFVAYRDEFVLQRMRLVGALQNSFERTLDLRAQLRNLEADLAQLRAGEILDLAGRRDAAAQPLIERAQVRDSFGDFADERELLL